MDMILYNKLHFIYKELQNHMYRKNTLSFLKWPGGKRWFVNKYSNIFPDQYNHYYEPFLGSGAVFFYLKPRRAVIADVNPELINLYKMMRDEPERLGLLLNNHQNQHDKNYYYKVRDTEFQTEIDRAARFLYLNRACYNGMYRVNRQGKFNVPIGTKSNFIYDIDQFEVYSRVLESAEIIAEDFENVIVRAQKNDLLFVDPPYTTKTEQNSFIKYNNHLFTWADQERLYNCLREAKKRGVLIILTNANCKEIRAMYQSGGFFTNILERKSSIAGKVSDRGSVKELLVTSFDIQSSL